MSATVRVLLVASQPEMAARLQGLLATPPLALAGRAASVSAAVEAVSQGRQRELAAIVIAAASRDLTADHLTTLARAGLRVVLVTTNGAAIEPGLLTTGAAVVAAERLTDAAALLALLSTGAREPESQGAREPRGEGAGESRRTGTREQRSADTEEAGDDAVGEATNAPVPELAGPPARQLSWARRHAVQAQAADSRPAPAIWPSSAPPRPTASRAAAPAMAANAASGVPQPQGHVVGRVIEFWSERGGAGGSRVAHAVADRLAGGEPVWLFDFDPDGDSLVSRWALTHPGAGLATLAGAQPTSDEGWRRLLATEIYAVGPRLSLLPGLERPADQALLSEVFVTRLLDYCRRQVPWTIVDLGRWRSGGPKWQRAARQAADLLLYVVEPTGHGVRAARATLAELGEFGDDWPGPTHQLVLNRCTGGAGHYPAADVSRQLGWPVLASLPADQPASARADQDAIPLSRTAGPLAEALRRLTEQVRAQVQPTTPTPAPVPAERRRFGLPALRLPTRRPMRPAADSST